ncbi:MAG: porin PorA family protein [Actinomycetota bacterium]
MKRSKGGLVLMIIGLIFLILTPVWKWAIAPMLVKLPDNINSPSVYEGTLTLFVDPNTLSLLPADMAVKIPLTITRVDTSDKAKYTSSIGVVEETVDAKGPAGKSFLTGDKFFAMDRRTNENVAGHGSNVDRTGYSVLLPFGTEKKSYPYWDDDVGKTSDINYVKEETRDGFKSKDVKVFIFEGSGTDPMVEPPFGLPDKLAGSQIKALVAGMPGVPPLNLNDTEEYPITFLKGAEAVIAIEPRTGTINDVDLKETYSVDTSTLGIPNIKLATLNYKQTPESVAWNIDNNAKNFGLLDLAQLWIPLILLILGIVLFVPGLILFLRPPRA